MIDIRLIREHPDVVKKGIAAKHIPIDFDAFVTLDKKYLAALQEIEQLRAKQNTLGAGVAKLAGEERAKRLEELKELKNQIAALALSHAEIETQWERAYRVIPNLPLPEVCEAADESGNTVLRTWAEPPHFGFTPKDHIALGEQWGILDFKRAGKLSGSRFVILQGKAATLQFALVRMAYDILIPHGFTPVIPPVLIREESMAAMGYMDRGVDEIYKTQDNLYLVGTSEQAIGPMHANEVLNMRDLPMRYLAYSPCFRREAGSYGKDTKGMIRVHQFDKLEMFSFVTPRSSNEEHEFLLKCEEELVQALGLPYHVLNICSGDLGDPAAKKYDIECYIPSENRYRETHSASNCTDFQARRLNIRYMNEATGATELVHTLNGTALAIGRMLVAIMENYQQEDGSIRIPEVLQPYCGFDRIA